MLTLLISDLFMLCLRSLTILDIFNLSVTCKYCFYVIEEYCILNTNTICQKSDAAKIFAELILQKWHWNAISKKVRLSHCSALNKPAFIHVLLQCSAKSSQINRQSDCLLARHKTKNLIASAFSLATETTQSSFLTISAHSDCFLQFQTSDFRLCSTSHQRIIKLKAYYKCALCFPEKKDIGLHQKATITPKQPDGFMNASFVAANVTSFSTFNFPFSSNIVFNDIDINLLEIAILTRRCVHWINDMTQPNENNIRRPYLNLNLRDFVPF